MSSTPALKRGSSALNSSTPAKKLKTDEDVLEQKDEETDTKILQYQNKKIRLRIMEKNRVISEQNRELAGLQHRLSTQERYVTQLHQTWQQLQDDLQLASKQLCVSNAEPLSATPAVSNFTKSSTVHPLVRLFTLYSRAGAAHMDTEMNGVKTEDSNGVKQEGESEETLEDSEESKDAAEQLGELQSALQQKQQFTVQLLNVLVENIQKYDSENEKLLKMLNKSAAGSADADSSMNDSSDSFVATLDKFATLQSNYHTLQSSHAELSQKYRIASQQLTKAQDTLLLTSTKNSELQKLLDEQKDNTAKITRRLERLEREHANALRTAATAATGNAPANTTATSTQPSANNSTQSSTAAPQPLASPPPSMSPLPDEHNDERIKQLSEQLEEAMFTSKARNSEISKLEAELRKLKQQLESAAKPAAITEQTVRDSIMYRTIQQELNALKQEYSAAKDTADRLRIERAGLESMLSTSEQTFTQLRQSLEKATEDVTAKYQRLLEEVNGRLANTQRDREELSSKLHGQVGYTALQSRAALVDELEKVNKAYATEIQQLKDERAAYSNFTTDIRTYYHHFAAVQRQWQQQEADLMARIATFEGSVTPGVQEIATVQGELARLKKENEMLQKELAALKSTDAGAAMEQLREEKSAAEEMSQSLMSELDGLVSSYEDVQQQVQRLLTLGADRDKLIQSLQDQRIRQQQSITAARTEREAYKGRATKLEQLIASSKVAMEKAEATATAASQRVLSLENTVKQLQSSNESFKRALSEKSSEFSALKTNYDSKHAEVRDTVARVEQLSKQLDDARVSFRIMKEKCELTADKLNTANEELKRKAASLPSRRTEEAWKTQEELMRQMRTRLKCSVCSDRDKNTVIKTCGHIFCRECMDNNMKTRNRKCPGCANHFGEKDLAPVFIE